MNKNIVLLDLFSGIGGFSKGLSDAGFNITTHYYSEIDKHAIAVYKYQFKNSEYVGSVVDLDGRTIDKVDIVTFGFPCQDLSIAGKRAGFEGKRSSLFYQAARVLRENQADRFIWENVAGLMSSNNGKDIESVFEELYLSGYLFDVGMMNTSWWLPQNRQRLYSVGVNIKYLQKCLLDQSGEKANYSSFVKVMEGCLLTKFPQYLTEVQNQSEQRQNDLVLEYVKTKEQREYNGAMLKERFLKIMSTLPLTDLPNFYMVAQQGPSKQCDINSDTWIQDLLIIIQGVIQSGTGKEKKTAREKFILSIEILLKRASEENLQVLNKCIILILINKTTTSKIFSFAEMQLNIELFIIHLNLLYPNCWDEALLNLIEKKKNINYAKIRRDQRRVIQENGDNVIQLSIGTGVGDESFGHLAERSGRLVFPFTNHSNQVNELQGYNSNTLTSRYYGAQAVGTYIGNCERNAQEVTCVAQRGREEKCLTPKRTEYGKEIRKEYEKGNIEEQRKNIQQLEPRNRDENGQAVLTSMHDRRIRRLTEIECERLQGFPDDWTATGDYDGVIKPVAKTQRYKMCGNAVTVKIVEMIGKRLLGNTDPRQS